MIKDYLFNWVFTEEMPEFRNNMSYKLKEDFDLIGTYVVGGSDIKLKYSLDKNPNIFKYLQKEIYPNYPGEVFTACVIYQDILVDNKYVQKPTLFVYKYKYTEK